MKSTLKQILALWQQDPAWRAAPRDVLRALGLKSSQQRLVQTALEQLVAEGQLVAKRGAYARAQGSTQDQAAARKVPDGVRFEGLFTAHPDGFGFVAVGALKLSLFIPPPEIGGALDGDWVRVELIPARGRHRTAGRVAEVLERRRVRVRGHVEREGKETWVLPLNERLPDVSIPPSAEAPQQWPHDALVDVLLTRYPDSPDEYPEGRIVGRVTDSEAPEQIIDNILANTSLHLGFSAETLREMAALGHTPPPPEATRVDLTHLPFATIDPVDARDMDDAICVEPRPGGHAMLWVAIADVAAYVGPGTAVDEDAYRKGTSVYFPSRVLPMLPEELSGDRCSLRPDAPRAALVCEMEIDPGGTTVAYKIYEALIHSRAKLSYGQVLHYFETGAGGDIPPALLPHLTQAREVARRLREKRDARGALGFVFPEARFQLGADGVPTDILRTLPTEATRLIEQCMLEANETVARHCAEKRLPVLYRVHDPPPGDALEQLALHLWNAGIQVKHQALETPGALNAVLQRLEQHPAREQLELLVLKSMSQAVYRASNDGHYALAATHYCHFTSPIRRYPDLLVHRALKAWLAGPLPPAPSPRGEGWKSRTPPPGPLPVNGEGGMRVTLPPAPSRKREGEKGAGKVVVPPMPSDASAHLSAFERIAADTEQQVIRLYRVLFMEPRVGEDFAAKVTGLNERGLTVSLRDVFVDGFLPLDTLRDDFYRLDPHRNAIEGRRHRKKIGLGAQLTVKLIRADRLTQQLEFGWEAWTAAPATPPPAPVSRRMEEKATPHRRKGDRGRPLPGAPG